MFRKIIQGVILSGSVQQIRVKEQGQPESAGDFLQQPATCDAVSLFIQRRSEYADARSFVGHRKKTSSYAGFRWDSDLYSVGAGAVIHTAGQHECFHDPHIFTGKVALFGNISNSVVSQAICKIRQRFCCYIQ